MITDFQKDGGVAYDNTRFPKESVGSGQNVINVTSWPINITLQTDKDKNYTVAFWAQSDSGIYYYDTKDLKNVKVNYNGYWNNSDFRDAFCASTTFSGATGPTGNIILRRPFAQVNVGSAGWDYESAAALKPSAVSYTHSMVTINGVAEYYNVVTGKASSEKKNITYISGVIPSYSKIDVEDIDSYKPLPDEEFLMVDLNGDGKLTEHVGWDSLYNYRLKNRTDFYGGKRPYTETFRYVSMSYILVPESDTSTETQGGTLDNIKCTVYGKLIDSAETKPESGDASSKYELLDIFDISNVPVQKNWRTNIIGDSYFTLDPSFKVIIVPDYLGDYNDTVNKGNWNIDPDNVPNGASGWTDWENSDWKKWADENNNNPNNNGPWNKPYPDDDEDPSNDDYYKDKPSSGNSSTES